MMILLEIATQLFALKDCRSSSQVASADNAHLARRWGQVRLWGLVGLQSLVPVHTRELSRPIDACMDCRSVLCVWLM